MPSRAEIVAAARGWIGTPYRHQGALKGVGCDCLGLLIGVWREVGGGDQPSRSALRLDKGGTVPPYTPDWVEAMGRETFVEGLREYLSEIDPRDARAGDLVLFRWRKHLPAKHAAILTAADRMVHAQERAAVAEVPVSDWWRRRMAYAFSLGGADRLLPATRMLPGCSLLAPKSGTPDFGWGKVAAEQVPRLNRGNEGEVRDLPPQQIAELPLSRSAPPTTLSLKGPVA